MKPLIGFGMWMSLTGIVIFIGRQLAGVVLGKVISVTALGFYQMAFLITQAAILDPVMAVTNVAFPALSKLQAEPDRFRRSCLMVIGLSAVVVMPLSTLVALGAGEIARSLLGAAWQPIIPALRVLAMACLAISMATLCEPIFLAGGQPRNMFKAQLCRAVCVAATAYPLALYGETAGAALSVLCGGCGMLGVSFFFVRRVVACAPGEISGLLLPPLIGCGAAAAGWTLAAMILSAAGSPIFSVTLVTLGIKLCVGLAGFAGAYHFSQVLNPTGIDFNALRGLLRRKSGI